MNISEGISIFNDDVFDHVVNFQSFYFDCIITDPMYDDRFDIDYFYRVCSGSTIMFCKPENQFFKPDEYLFWIKTPSTKNYSKNCGRFVEMILINRGSVFNRLHWSQMTGVYDDRLIQKPIHPYQKPLALIERLVRIYTNPGDLVFDPFMGSGTTAIACKNLGRRFLGFEIDQDHFEVAKNRIKQELIK